MLSRALLSITMLLLLPLSLAGAQADSTQSTSSEAWQVGGAVLLPQTSDEYGLSFLALGITATSVRPGRIGPDLAFVVVPRALQAGALVGGVRANAGFPVALSPAVVLLPSAGVSLLGAAGLFGVAGVGGLNATMALHFFRASESGLPAKSGLRVALGQHRFSGAGGNVTFVEFGFVRR